MSRAVAFVLRIVMEAVDAESGYRRMVVCAFWQLRPMTCTLYTHSCFTFPSSEDPYPFRARHHHV